MHGKYIKQKRLELGLSQDYIASELHISRQALSKYENEDVELSLDIIQDLSRIYNIHQVDIILCEDGASERLTEEELNEVLQKFKDDEKFDNLIIVDKVKLYSNIIKLVLAVMLGAALISYYITYCIIKPTYYTIISDNENVTLSGSITKTNKRIQFLITNISTDIEYDKIRLFYKDNKTEKTIYSINSPFLIINDTIYTKEFFYFSNFKEICNNLYLEILSADNSVISKLIINKNFSDLHIVDHDDSLSFSKNNGLKYSIEYNNTFYNIYEISNSILDISSKNGNINFNYTINDEVGHLNFFDYSGNSFEYNTTTKEYISGTPDDEKVKLFYTLYELYKEKYYNN